MKKRKISKENEIAIIQDFEQGLSLINTDKFQEAKLQFNKMCKHYYSKSLGNIGFSKIYEKEGNIGFAFNKLKKAEYYIHKYHHSGYYVSEIFRIWLKEQNIFFTKYPEYKTKYSIEKDISIYRKNLISCLVSISFGVLLIFTSIFILIKKFPFDNFLLNLSVIPIGIIGIMFILKVLNSDTELLKKISTGLIKRNDKKTKEQKRANIEKFRSFSNTEKIYNVAINDPYEINKTRINEENEYFFLEKPEDQLNRHFKKILESQQRLGKKRAVIFIENIISSSLFEELAPVILEKLTLTLSTNSKHTALMTIPTEDQTNTHIVYIETYPLSTKEIKEKVFPSGYSSIAPSLLNTILTSLGMPTQAIEHGINFIHLVYAVEKSPILHSFVFSPRFDIGSLPSDLN